MSPIRMSKIESGVRAVLEFNEAFNRHDVAGMMKLTSEDCVFEDTSPAPDGTVYSGKAAMTRYFEDLFRETPGAHIEIEDVFGMGFHCIMRWKYEWTDAAGEKAHVRGADIFKLKDNLISEIRSYVKA